MQARRNVVQGCSLLLVAALCTACASSLGPATIPRDRIDYGASIARAAQEQLLTNLVKLRYLDQPVFLEVSSIINQYSLEGQLSAGGAFPGITDRSAYSVNVGARYADKPTISYAPLSGERFIKSLLTPIRPESLLSLVQAGWPIDVVFLTTVRAINGVYNRSRTPIFRREPDPEFLQLLAALRRIQSANAVGFRLEDKDGSKALIVFRGSKPSPEVAEDMRLVRTILGLNADEGTFQLSFGVVPATDRDVVILSRSMLEMMSELAATIEVAEKDVAEKRTSPTNREQSEVEKSIGPLMGIRSSEQKPEDAFVSVFYRKRWFWIDDRDMPSKRAFGFLGVFFDLAQAGVVPSAPMVTVSAGS